MQSRLIGMTCPFSGKVLDECGLPTDDTEGLVLELSADNEIDPEHYICDEITYTPEQEAMMRKWLDDRIAVVRASHQKYGETPYTANDRAAERGVEADVPIDPINKLFDDPLDTIKHLIRLGYSDNRISLLVNCKVRSGYRAKQIAEIREQLNAKAA